MGVSGLVCYRRGFRSFKKAPKAAGKQAEKKRLDFDGPPVDEPF